MARRLADTCASAITALHYLVIVPGKLVKEGGDVLSPSSEEGLKKKRKGQNWFHNTQVERAVQESRRISPTSTAAVHASRTAQQPPAIVTHATTCHRYPHPAGSSPDPVTQRSPPAAKHRRAEPHFNTDIIRPSGDTQRPPPGGGHYQEWLMDSQGRECRHQSRVSSSSMSI